MMRDIISPELADDASDLSADLHDSMDEGCDDNSTDSLGFNEPIVSVITLSSTSVLACSMDDKAYIVNIEDSAKLNVIQTLEGHSDTVVSAAVSFKLGLIATASYDCSVRLWSYNTFECLHVVDSLTSEIDWVSWKEDGLTLLCGCQDGSAWLWDFDLEGQIIKSTVLSSHTDMVTSGTFTSDGKMVITVSMDSLCIGWDLLTGKPLFKVRVANGGILCIKNHPDRNTVALATDAGELALVNYFTGKLVGINKTHEAPIESAEFSPTGDFFCSGSTDGFIQIREKTRLLNNYRHSIKADEMGISNIMWHETEKLILIGTVSGGLKVYDPLSGSCYLTLHGNQGPILSLCNVYLQNGQTAVFTGGDDASVRMFSIQLEDDDI